MAAVLITLLSALSVIAPALLARLALGPAHDLKLLRDHLETVKAFPEGADSSKALMDDALLSLVRRYALRLALAENRRKLTLMVPYFVVVSAGAGVGGYYLIRFADSQNSLFYLILGALMCLMAGLAFLQVVDLFFLLLWMPDTPPSFSRRIRQRIRRPKSGEPPAEAPSEVATRTDDSSVRPTSKDLPTET